MVGSSYQIELILEISRSNDTALIEGLRDSFNSFLRRARVAKFDTYILSTKREVKVAGYCPSSLLAFLWTEAKSRFIKTQKKERD